MLTQFVMLAAGLLAVMALVIDVGQAVLAREQLQLAADIAAIETVRLRNVGRTMFDESADGFVGDCVRRASARNLVSWTFDDDFIVGADALNLGAGEDITFDGGDPSLNTGQTIVGTGVFKPVLEANQAENQRYGDIVSGRFEYTTSPVLDEDASYERRDGSPTASPDFTPGLPVPSGTSGLTACPADAPTTKVPDFTGVPASGAPSVEDEAALVRLRRTRSTRIDRNNPLDSIPGVSSSGPTLPLLFARGALMPAADPDPTTYSPRHDGLAVRATAIAQAALARRIGEPTSVAPEMGATAFVLDAPCWNLDTWGTVPSDSSNPDEVWASVIAPPLPGGNEGWVLRTSACATAGAIVPISSWRVGEQPRPAEFPIGTSVMGPPVAFDESGFTPISTVIGGVDRVVAFGRSRLTGVWPPSTTCDITNPSDTGCLRLTRRNVSSNQPRVAPWNASATLPDGFPSDLAPADIPLVLAAGAGVRAALRAPVLAR
ncbi:MAG: Tad domain-containing protein [Vicinamibacterales bacterium]